jgi:hypothetical protein
MLTQQLQQQQQQQHCHRLRNLPGTVAALHGQAINDKLLDAAVRENAAYTSTCDDPTYPIQLAKVEGREAQPPEQARAAAAAAKAARWAGLQICRVAACTELHMCLHDAVSVGGCRDENYACNPRECAFLQVSGSSCFLLSCMRLVRCFPHAQHLMPAFLEHMPTLFAHCLFCTQPKRDAVDAGAAAEAAESVL